MSNHENPSSRKRERSTRYPGSTLAESVDLCRFVESKGLDGLPATEIATALGYKSVKTNTFSSRLSAARQFGLLELKDEGYALTALARSILHPVDPADLPQLLRRALVEPPLYAELAARLDGRKVPEAAILANVLYHQHQIISTAKDAAAEVFLESARFAGALGGDGAFSPHGTAANTPAPDSRTGPPPLTKSPNPPEPPSSTVRIDLRLWGADEGKTLRVRAPESISAESFDRLIQTLKLHIRIDS